MADRDIETQGDLHSGPHGARRTGKHAVASLVSGCIRNVELGPFGAQTIKGTNGVNLLLFLA